MGQGSKKKLHGKDVQQVDDNKSMNIKKQNQRVAEKKPAAAKKATPSKQTPKPKSDEKLVLSKSVLEKKEIKRLIQKGKERGSISFDELNEGLGPEINTLEEIENVIAVLAEADIEVIDEASKGFPDLMPRDSDEEYEDEGA